MFDVMCTPPGAISPPPRVFIPTAAAASRSPRSGMSSLAPPASSASAFHWCQALAASTSTLKSTSLAMRSAARMCVRADETDSSAPSTSPRAAKTNGAESSHATARA